MPRVLLVEDDVLIGLMVADMLAELGYEVTGPVGRVAAGVDAVAAEEFDLAVLDVNLHGEPSFPIADALDAKNVPYVFATGYGAEGTRARSLQRPVLTKPFDLDALQTVLNAL